MSEVGWMKWCKFCEEPWQAACATSPECIEANRKELTAQEICEEYAGHEWAPAGGGLEICMRCEVEAERPIND